MFTPWGKIGMISYYFLNSPLLSFILEIYSVSKIDN